MIELTNQNTEISHMIELTNQNTEISHMIELTNQNAGNVPYPSLMLLSRRMSSLLATWSNCGRLV